MEEYLANKDCKNEGVKNERGMYTCAFFVLRGVGRNIGVEVSQSSRNVEFVVP